MSEFKSSFSLVCDNCDAVGVQIELTEEAPPWTPVLCAKCKSPRGTLGGLRTLSEMDHEVVDRAAS
jgi:hypothetical protein